jgi:uncharacterized protein (DUF433 family)
VKLYCNFVLENVALAGPIYDPGERKGARMVATNDSVVTREPEVMHGELVFAGTRVPAKTLVDYIKAGHTLDNFLEGFPSVVPRKKAEAYLEMTLEAADLARASL